MPEFDYDERSKIEEALSGVRARPAPVELLLTRHRARQKTAHAYRLAALIATCAVLTGVFAISGRGGAVLAAVHDALFPTHPSEIIVLPASRAPSKHETLHRVDTLANAQARVPFPLLVAQTNDSWHLETILASEPDGNPSVELLYRVPARGAWVKIAERPASAPLFALDADLSDMLYAPQAKQVSGRVTLAHTGSIKHRSSIRTIGAVRVTMTQTMDGGAFLLDVPLRTLPSAP
jgi:hypothetical protein